MTEETGTELIADFIGTIANILGGILGAVLVFFGILIGAFFILRFMYFHFLGFHHWARYWMETFKRRSFHKRNRP